MAEKLLPLTLTATMLGLGTTACGQEARIEGPTGMPTEIVSSKGRQIEFYANGSTRITYFGPGDSGDGGRQLIEACDGITLLSVSESETGADLKQDESVNTYPGSPRCADGRLTPTDY